MFSAFFYLLRARGLDVSLNEWLTLMEALEKGLAQSSLTSFYYLARAILVKSETEYDTFDVLFWNILKMLSFMTKYLRSLWTGLIIRRKSPITTIWVRICITAA